jgi:hypothetical protein
LTLDGAIISSLELSGLSEGFHNLKISTADSSGNLAEKTATFEIDTSPPSYSGVGLSGSGPYVQGSKLSVEGQTEPGTRVELGIKDGALKTQTIADLTGHFSFEIPTSDLSAGVHEIYLTLYDALSNAITVNLSPFEISPVANQTQQPVKLAQADRETKSDIQPRIIKTAASYQRELSANKTIDEVAKSTGSISSVSESKPGVNWTLYLLIFGLIIITGTVLTAGYYGYEVLTDDFSKAKTLPIEKYSKNEPDDGLSISQEIAAKGELDRDLKKEDENNKQVRW